MSDFTYKAFISYSHQDSRIAAWLQRAIESYQLPKTLSTEGFGATRSTRRVGRVFRDRDELSAGRDLGESIRSALLQSEFLIVVCSPASAKSRWVNLEIEQFRKTHDAEKILSIVVGGEPLASTVSGDFDRECFPPALQYGAGDATGLDVYEPVAADVRKGRDGRRLAKLKIISGLVGVGLDALVQRDTQRRYRKMLGLSVGSFVGMILMAVLSFVAIDARNGEQLRRAEAEDLIEFMLGDLRERLDDVGRLDVLDSVGEKAIEYYSKVKLTEHSDSALGRRARAFHLLGEVDDLRGDTSAARSAFEEAYNSTRELVRRTPNERDVIFDHAQSVFWVGYLDWRLGNLDSAEKAFSEYLSLANRLVEMDPENAKWQIEFASANLNLGVYSLETDRPSSSIPYFQVALSVYQRALETDPSQQGLRFEIAQAHAWLADAYEFDKSLTNSSAERLSEVRLYKEMLKGDPGNQNIRLSLMSARISQADLAMQQGHVEIAVQYLREAKSIGDELRELDAENTLIAEQSASISADLAEALWYGGFVEDAPPLLDEAENTASHLLQLDADILDWQILWHTFRIQRAKFLLATSSDNPDSIFSQLLPTLEGLHELFKQNPQAKEIGYLIAEANFLMGEAQRLTGSELEAKQYAVLVVEQLAAQESELPLRPLAILSRAYRASGSNEKAEEIDAFLDSIGFQHPEHSRPKGRQAP